MPGGDGTGPMGMGPMTGRGAGYCAGYATPGYAHGFGGRFGRGPGRNFGRGGRGWRNRSRMTGLTGWQRAPGAMPVDAAPSREQELEMLRAQADDFDGALQNIRRRIQELESQKD